MLSASSIWRELVSLIQATGLFADVRPLPLNKAADLKFLDTFPGIRMPACLLVCTARSRTIRGSGDDRAYRFNAILVAADPSGSAEMAYGSLDRLEELESRICDQTILDGEVVVHGSSEAEAQVTNPRFSVYELALSCRQAAQREGVVS
jgi:hypothetical protein